MKNQKPEQSPLPTILSFVKDLPNICSLAGLFCTVLAIYYALLGTFPLAIIAILWAVVFDWADGIIARKMTGRTDHQRAFGTQLDSLIDIVSFGVFPAIFLLSYGEFNLWFLPGAFLIIAACAIRLSYFNIFGLVDDKTYKGMAVDNNAIILAFVFLFEGFFEHAVFSLILYALIIVLLGLNVAPIRTPKLTGKWFYALITYSFLLTVLYGWILCSKCL